MGTGKAGCGRKGLHTKNKQYKRGHDLKRRGRDLDQVQDDMKKVDDKTGKPVVSIIKFDNDLPGLVTCYKTKLECYIFQVVYSPDNFSNSSLSSILVP
jgi:hypothetical protein